MIIKKYRYETLDSTNTMAKKLAMDFADEGTLVIAEHQTAGRGRLGRSWEAGDADDIKMSMILRPQMPAETYSMITIVCALAVNEAIRNICGLETKIKWPNDIMHQGKKLCGILTEAVIADPKEVNGNANFAVAGIGINVNSISFPEEVKDKAISLRMLTGKKWDREKLTDGVWEEFDKYYAVFRKDGDLRRLKSLYNERTLNINSHVERTDYNNEKYVSGTAMGINDKGYLRVKIDDGSEVLLYSGEIR